MCRYHDREPEFKADSNFGQLPCCKQKVGKFDPQLAELNQFGCKSRRHTPDTTLTSIDMINKIEMIHKEQTEENENANSTEKKQTSLAQYLEEYFAHNHKYGKQRYSKMYANTNKELKKKTKVKFKDLEINQIMHENRVNEGLYQNVLKNRTRMKQRNGKNNGSVLIDHEKQLTVPPSKNTGANTNQADSRDRKMKLEIGLLGRIKKKNVKTDVKNNQGDKSQSKNKNDETNGSDVKKVFKNIKKEPILEEQHQKSSSSDLNFVNLRNAQKNKDASKSTNVDSERKKGSNSQDKSDNDMKNQEDDQKSDATYYEKTNQSQSSHRSSYFVGSKQIESQDEEENNEQTEIQNSENSAWASEESQEESDFGNSESESEDAEEGTEESSDEEEDESPSFGPRASEMRLQSQHKRISIENLSAKKNQSNINVFDVSRQISGNFHNMWEPSPLLTPKGNPSTVRNQQTADGKNKEDQANEQNMATKNQIDFDFANQMQLYREEKIQQKLVRHQYLKYKRKRRLNFIEQDNFGGQKMQDFVQNSSMNKQIIQDQMHLQGLHHSYQGHRPVIITPNGLGKQSNKDHSSMTLPEYVVQGPLFANPIEQKIRLVKQKLIDPNQKKQTNNGNNFSDYFGMVAQQMRPEKINQMRQRRQWRMDFLTNHYDPHQCFTLTCELKQYRKNDRQFHNVLTKSKKHR